MVEASCCDRQSVDLAVGFGVSALAVGILTLVLVVSILPPLGFFAMSAPAAVFGLLKVRIGELVLVGGAISLEVVVENVVEIGRVSPHFVPFVLAYGGLGALVLGGGLALGLAAALSPRLRPLPQLEVVPGLARGSESLYLRILLILVEVATDCHLAELLIDPRSRIALQKLLVVELAFFVLRIAIMRRRLRFLRVRCLLLARPERLDDVLAVCQDQILELLPGELLVVGRDVAPQVPDIMHAPAKPTLHAFEFAIWRHRGVDMGEGLALGLASVARDVDVGVHIEFERSEGRHGELL